MGFKAASVLGSSVPFSDKPFSVGTSTISLGFSEGSVASLFTISSACSGSSGLFSGSSVSPVFSGRMSASIGGSTNSS